MEFEVVDGADSSLEDDAGPDGSSEADKLFTVLRGMWTQPSKKQTKKNKEKVREIDDNGDEPLVEKKKHRGKRRKWATEPSTKGKLNAPRNHMIDVVSHRACACQRPLT